MKPLKKCKVLVTPTSYASQDESLKTILEEKVGEVIYNTTGKPLSSAQLQSMLAGVDGMIAGLDEINAAAMADAPDLKVIARYGVGCNNVDLEAAMKHQITVTNTPGANAKSVAELTIALILNLLRPILPAVKGLSEGDWPRLKGSCLEGKTVGLLGLGAIGKETARRLAGFDCAILAYDINQDEVFSSKNHVTYVPLDVLINRADIVSLHLPGTPETAGMVDENFFAQMKMGSWIVNTARGDLIIESALINALNSGKLRGAAVDVYRQEPPEKENPLLQMEQVIATPHMGAHSDSAANAMGRIALEECLLVLQGLEPTYRIV
ncbi:MAG: phosphoglycerate dehydrogenase [Desulfobacteraceae bacterium]|nr:phosphoglycerate dehydrogenase [Desulfobacteraceae bacterium]